tara:strand:- start:486 stop:1649 length:1164 start_codon:yes stop_codon:yes gene_type:complete
MANFYTLTRESIKKLQADHQRIRTAIVNLQQAGNRMAFKATQRDDSLVAKATGAVAARSGTATASGTFTIQDVATTGALSDTTDSATVFNLGDTAITSGDYYNIHRDYRTGKWVTHAPGSGGGSVSVNICYVKALYNWEYTGDLPSAGGGMAWCEVKKVDRDGTNPTGAAFDVWLPTPPHMDPNVIQDQVFCVAQFEDQSDSATSWAAISDISDLAIGSVKMMTGNTPTAAQGWVPLDGNQDVAKTAGGNAIDMDGRSPLAAALGANGGDLAPSDTTSSVSVAVSITGAAANTGSSETGIEGTSSEPAGDISVTTETINHDSAGMDEIDVVTEVTDDGLDHSHTITDPGHTHTVTGTFTGTASAHTHEIDLHPWAGILFYERINNAR